MQFSPPSCQYTRSNILLTILFFSVVPKYVPPLWRKAKLHTHITLRWQEDQRSKTIHTTTNTVLFYEWTYLSILFKATINGVFLLLRRFMDSIVCGSKPCIMSTTRIAISQREEPLLRRLLNDSCPGVSMISKPGIRSSVSANCTTQYTES